MSELEVNTLAENLRGAFYYEIFWTYLSLHQSMRGNSLSAQLQLQKQARDILARPCLEHQG